MGVESRTQTYSAGIPQRARILKYFDAVDRAFPLGAVVQIEVGEGKLKLSTCSDDGVEITLEMGPRGI